jgi:excisionase family DNA binding protein
MITITDKLLVASAEAAAMLGISERTLLSMRKAGEIQFIRVRDGRKGIRYSVLELRHWIADRQERAGVGGAK